jgi:hypothetical protein
MHKLGCTVARTSAVFHDNLLQECANLWQDPVDRRLPRTQIVQIS